MNFLTEGPEFFAKTTKRHKKMVICFREFFTTIVGLFTLTNYDLQRKREHDKRYSATAIFFVVDCSKEKIIKTQNFSEKN